MEAENDLVGRFRQLSDQVRHPALALSDFVSADLDLRDLDLDDDDTDPFGELPEDLSGLPPEELDRAHARRGALVYAANLVYARVLDDFAALRGAGLVDRFDEESLADDMLPRRFRHHYDLEFHRKLVATVAKVAADLCSPNAGYPSCTAEELVYNAIVVEWQSLLELAELGPAHGGGLEDALYEDLDFENLFDDSLDGIEDDPLDTMTTGRVVRGPASWFVPFNTYSIVHPYAADLSEKTNQLYDLTGDETTDPLALPPASPPILGFEAISDDVAEARDNARQTEPEGTWVPNPTEPVASLAAAPGGPFASGYLTLQPQPDRAVTTVPVLDFVPHGAHPRTGEAWAAVSYMSGRSEIPLGAIVAFQPDADVRVRWEAIWQPNG